MNTTSQDDIDRLVNQRLAVIHWETLVKLAAAEAERDLLKRDAAKAKPDDQHRDA